MVNAALDEAVRVKVALDGIHLDHRVADRRTGGEGDAVACVLLMKETGFHIQIEGAFTAAGLNASNPLHFGRGFEILEVVAFVNEDVVDAQFVKDQAVVFFLCGQEVFEPFLAFGFLLLDGLDDVAVRAGGLGGGAVAKELVVFRDLLTQKPLLVVAGHADAFKGAVRHDDAIPGAACHFRGQELPAVAGKVLLASNQKPCVGIQLHELAAKLLQHVIGDDIEGFGKESGLLHLHACCGHFVGFASANRMGQERVAATHNAPDSGFLVGGKRDRLAHAGKGEVGAVKGTKAQVVVGIVIQSDEAFGAVGIGEEPALELLFDLLLLLAGCERFLLIEHALFLAVAARRCHR